MFIRISTKILLGKRIVPWTIVDLLTEDRTFSTVFSEVKAGKYDSIPDSVCDELKSATIKQVLVGSNVDNLMVVGEKQSVFTICQEFGKFVEFRAELLEKQNVQLIPTRNAFDIMVMAQRQAQFGDKGVPAKVLERTSKDRLFNELIQLMKDIDVKWSDPKLLGVPFLKKLAEVLWYIDGHHHTIAEHAPPIPSLFSTFTGYNCPEKHKHRKRTRDNLLSSEMNSHSLTLCDFVQASWFKKDQFKQLRKATEDLMVCLQSYASFLQEKLKLKHQKLLHNTSITMLEDSSHIDHIQKSSRTVPCTRQ